MIGKQGYEVCCQLKLCEMKKKTSESTPMRPDGERVLNAPLVQIDLNKYIEQIKSEATWENSSYNSMTLFKSEAMTIVLIGMHAKAILKKHTTNAVISVQTVTGQLNFITEEQSVELSKGEMVTLQPMIPHSVEAQEESFFLLTLSALRKI